MYESNSLLPDTYVSLDNGNPTISSPNSPFEISFYQTRESLADTEDYKAFIENAIFDVRHSRTYKNYKSFLYDLGLDHSQVHGNINKDMAKIEMHHNVLTIFDIAMIITEHILNTTGYITTFDLEMLLKQEHRDHHVQLVMLDVTSHQLFHDDPQFFIPSSMCIGDWTAFLKKYSRGVTQDIAYKILYYIRREQDLNGELFDNNLLELRDEVINWSYNNR